MNLSEKMPFLLFLSASFFFGLICIGNPFLVARLIAWLFLWPVSKLTNNSEIEEVLDLINEPDAYMEDFSGQIQTIRRAGYIGISAILLGTCIVLSCGLG